ncbi:MAG: hypothetical protein JWQ57_1045 [Mucilaginibacter sp.]|nr:hypothetical protein [Mucilaginibacter sp.]
MRQKEIIGALLGYLLMKPIILMAGLYTTMYMHFMTLKQIQKLLILT